MTRLAAGLKGLGVFGAIWLGGCGLEDQSVSERNRRIGSASENQAVNTSDGSAGSASPRLAHAANDQVISTLVIPFGRDGMQLTEGDDGTIQWVVDMEERETVSGGVAPKKYLKIKGDLQVPTDANNEPYEVGCLYIELKDNVYYREKTWLRLATTGIAGKTYTEVKLPIEVDLGGWKQIPELEDSLTLQQFASNSLKKFDATVCFRLDFTEAPAQQYEGDLIVQYLRPGQGENPPACDQNPDQEACQPEEQEPGEGDPEEQEPTPVPYQFACTKDPLVLKAQQDAELAWTDGDYSSLELKLKADPSTYQGDLGTVESTGKTTASYRAPSAVPSDVRIIVTARPIGTEILPAFCEVRLVPDEDIGIPDDGETQGITGNVYKLPASTTKLPNFSKMTPVAHVIAPNLDIPERAFSAGFPGVADLFEWFGIRFKGRLIVSPEMAGQCHFKLTSDDGANLYINGQKAVDNDGVHPTRSVEGSVNLSAGQHDFMVDYFQGPRYHITLQLFWKCNNATKWTIVPPSAFVRPLQ